jgi:hypothetical protein
MTLKHEKPNIGYTWYGSYSCRHTHETIIIDMLKLKNFGYLFTLRP